MYRGSILIILLNRCKITLDNCLLHVMVQWLWTCQASRVYWKRLYAMSPPQNRHRFTWSVMNVEVGRVAARHGQIAHGGWPSTFTWHDHGVSEARSWWSQQTLCIKKIRLCFWLDSFSAWIFVCKWQLTHEAWHIRWGRTWTCTYPAYLWSRVAWACHFCFRCTWWRRHDRKYWRCWAYNGSWND